MNDLLFCMHAFALCHHTHAFIETASMASTATESSGWDCRSFDAAAYKAEILAQRADQFSTVHATCFVLLPSDILHHLGRHDPVDQELLVAAYSTGLIRVFKLKEAVAGWLRQRALATPCMCWQAHKGAATSCIQTGSGINTLLVTGGADGVLKCWRLLDVVSAMLTVQPPSQGPGAGQGVTSQRPLTTLTPCHTLLLPPPGGSQCWSATNQASSSVTCLTAHEQLGTVYAGASDGTVHVFQLQGNLPVTSNICGKHLAGVLTMDLASSAGLLGTGGEDGMVRLWDVRSKAPTSILCPLTGKAGEAGHALPGSYPPASLIPLIRTSPAVTSLKFGGPTGGWLLVGVDAATPTLASWSLDGGLMPAQRISLQCTPQVLACQPGEVLVAGTGHKLYTYTFSGKRSSIHDLAPQMRSVFALDVLPGPQGGSGDVQAQAGRLVSPGAVVVGGSGGCLEVLSRYSTRLASTHLCPDDDDEEE